MIERLCIIGVGLIGGSLALALKKAGFCQTVIGIGRSAKNLELALEKKVIDVASHDFSAVKEADMVVLATPVGSTEKVCREIVGYLAESAVFTDVGSVKKAIVKQVESAFGKLPPNFVPGHPIAGNENSGAGAAIHDLFTGRRVLLTPAESTSEDALDKVRAMWQATGALVETMSIEHHDRSWQRPAIYHTCWPLVWLIVWLAKKNLKKFFATRPEGFGISPALPPAIQ